MREDLMRVLGASSSDASRLNNLAYELAKHVTRGVLDALAQRRSEQAEQQSREARVSLGLPVDR